MEAEAEGAKGWVSFGEFGDALGVSEAGIGHGGGRHVCEYESYHFRSAGDHRGITRDNVGSRRDHPCSRQDTDISYCTVAQKTAPMFAHFGKIGMVRSSDISKKSDIII